MKDRIHQTIPSDIFCPGKTETNPYEIPNDLQEPLRRLHRRSTKMKDPDDIVFVTFDFVKNSKNLFEFVLNRFTSCRDSVFTGKEKQKVLFG